MGGCTGGENVSEEKKQDLAELHDILESLDEKDLTLMLGGAITLKARKQLEANQPSK